MNSHFKPFTKEFLIALTALSLTACGGGGSSNPPPSSGNPPAPAPAPPPPPPPPSGSVPPLSATVQDITDGHRIGDARWPDPQRDGNPIGSFNCVVNTPDDFAFNAHLSILVNNEPQQVPSRIGSHTLSAGNHCFYTIHTHEASGKVHVTPDAAGTFTLGQLFELWNQPLTNTNVAGITGLPIQIFVTDGTTTVEVAEADWANIELKSHREITIGLGTPVAEIPNFTWTD
jgi:hypothetical protein